jgi:hypothetical protein
MRGILGLAAAAAVALAAGSASAIELRNGMGGTSGYGTNFLTGNDDGSSPLIPLPFSINFFGNNYSSAYVNNNGNITFNGAVGAYTPRPFPISQQPMIAPYWGDVDTRCSSCGLTYYAGTTAGPGPNDDRFTVTWHDVGYYSEHADLTNDFQMTLIERSDTGAGNFDIEFRYNRLEWTTGDASSGHGGLGGTPAQAGYDAGNGNDYFALPGSFSENILNLEDTSNVSGDTPGLWYFNIRNGQISDGSTPQAPVVPTIVDPETGAFQFDFGVSPGQLIYVDPAVAVGYDFQVLDGGPNILTALFPVLAGQSGPYHIYTLDGLTLLGDIFGGATFDFGAGGVSGFRLLGIDSDLALDPDNSLAFVTGLTFDTQSPTNVRLSQTPLTEQISNAVPEPGMWMLLIMGFGGMGAALRTRRRGLALA